MTVENFMTAIFDLEKIDGAIEELKRAASVLPNTKSYSKNRIDNLMEKKDAILKKLDDEYVPLEVAPIEQYIKIEKRITV